jgi:aspartate 1-decarboxylase
MLRAKLHGIRVTGAELDYEGSIALDPEHCRQADLLPFEFVDIWNKSNGARISTYVIHGAPGSGCCVLNGAAARTCQVGDELIIAASVEVEEKDIASLQPRVLIFDAQNRVRETLVDRIHRNSDGGAVTVRDSSLRRLAGGE